ncbi:sulfatase [Christiangramia crocea]|uniref:Sulfatase n=1 Tax=Christiangramia crocea TaxID=2904124 RepID=A0A9X2A707_9FLAO|nr:sulfatase [Gramella crocea]MCG9972555.1 sulfatase [Gramella crocea]
MKTLFSFLLIFTLYFSAGAQEQNFVFILVDDLGWKDLGYMGSEFYETPNIDSLSRESIQFDNAYSSGSVCSPSRAAILTGKHPARLKITDWIPGARFPNKKLKEPPILNELPLEEITIAEKLKENNYSTFYVGKWHLGKKAYSPEHQGFDKNIGGFHKGSPAGGYYSPYNNPALTDGPKGEYLTDRLTNESINFLDSIGKKPFFLYLSFYSVHTPIQSNEKYISKFKKKLASLNNPKSNTRKERKGITTLEQYNPNYASMVYAMDKNIGRLIQKLKEEGLYENTTLIFTSDNGGLTTIKNTKKRIAPTAVIPLRAGKGWLYEGGIRVPLLIKPAGYNEGIKIISEPVIGHDFFPTILSMAEIAYESNNLDGNDISPLITGKGNFENRDLFWYYPHYHGSAWSPGAAIRHQNWKLIQFYETGKKELYNLKYDISEINDLSSKYSDKVKQLENRLQKLQKKTSAKKILLRSSVESQIR